MPSQPAQGTLLQPKALTEGCSAVLWGGLIGSLLGLCENDHLYSLLGLFITKM